jgi:hypothetical protein
MYFEPAMNATPRSYRTTPSHDGSLACLIRAAVRGGYGIGSTVAIGSVRGVVIGYNIARHGPFPGQRFPLLIETELGTGKFALDEVATI